MKTRNLTSTLFGKTRRAVLSVLYGNVDDAFYFRQLSRITGINIGSLQRELRQLSEGGIIIRSVQGKQVYFRANKDCPVFKELKSIVIKTVGIADSIRSALSSLENKISVAFIYGSFATGDEKKGSDIDLLVIGDVSFNEVVSSLSAVQQTIGREINPAVYPVKEFKTKIMEKHHFLSSVIQEPAIFIIGEKGEFEKMAGKRLVKRT